MQASQLPFAVPPEWKGTDRYSVLRRVGEGSRTAQRSNAAFSHARLFSVYSLFYLGRLREHARRAARLLADSERRGDLYTAVNLYAAPIVDDCLAADDPDAARGHLRRGLATWTQNGFPI